MVRHLNVRLSAFDLGARRLPTVVSTDLESLLSKVVPKLMPTEGSEVHLYFSTPKKRCQNFVKKEGRTSQKLVAPKETLPLCRT